MRLPPAPPQKRGRQGITQLDAPKPRFNPARTPDFESWLEAAKEDGLRAARLRLRAKNLPRAEARELCRLADAVDPEVTRYPTTLASSRYMRRQRIRIVGALWEQAYLATCTAPGGNSTNCVTATIVWADCSRQLGTLHLLDPERFKAIFRQHIYRSAAALGLKVEGQLFAALHGAYDPTTNSYPIHIHLMAIGGMIPIVDGLRGLPMYRPAQPYDGRDAANTPVRMSSKPLSNMPDPLTYNLKSYWPLRETYIDNDGLRKARSSKVRRIPEPAHTEVLQFLDRCRLEDITLMMGMSVKQGRLVLR